MSQQINLLNHTLIKKRDFLTPTNLLLTSALLSAGLLGYYSYIQVEIASLAQQRDQIVASLISAQELLKQTTLSHTPREADKTLASKIAQLELKTEQQQKILKTIKASASDPGNSYATLMLAFSRQAIDGLWLTSFKMDSEKNTLNISGRALRSELIPEYISRLGDEPMLKGKKFDTLSIGTPATDPNKLNPALDSTAPSASQNNNIATNRANKDPVLPDFIEFSLRSHHQNDDLMLNRSPKTGSRQ